MNMREYDMKSFEQYLSSYTTVEQAWLPMLKKYIIESRDSVHYIAHDEVFMNITASDYNWLSNLTISNIGVLYEFSLSFFDASSRNDKGQYFTPDDVARKLALFTLDFDDNAIWCDPCVGVGNLMWHCIDVRVNKEDFLLNHVVVQDIDDFSLLIARIVFTVDFQNEIEDLFYKIEENFRVKNFVEQPESKQLNATDYTHIIMNPPYVSGYVSHGFITSSCKEMYTLFMENALATTDGFVSITPQSYTCSQNMKPLRSLLLDSGFSFSMMHCDNVPGRIFDGIKFGKNPKSISNNTRASIMVARKDNANNYKTTSLLRWTSKERKEFIQNIDNFQTVVSLSEQVFPKISKQTSALFSDVSTGYPMLVDFLVKESNYPLHVPSTPRYYISALRQKPQRSSLRTLFFADENTRNKAYVLLNSSFAYWWWRVMDSGMTLSLGTLKTLPFVNHNEIVDNELVQQLVDSELKNKVIKMNAGKPQENVKHPIDLVQNLNYALFQPEYAEILLKSHRNSDIQE